MLCRRSASLSSGAATTPSNTIVGIASQRSVASVIGESLRGLVPGSEKAAEVKRMAKEIEKRTAQIPSDVFLWAAGASVVGSAVLHFMNRKETSNFVGQWAPTLLILGVYNKLVKQRGHD